MQEVEAMCDRAFIIDRGNIVADSLSMSDIGKRGKSLEEIFREVTKS
jgi:ABC-2 type transport system ATP-binding protein